MIVVMDNGGIAGAFGGGRGAGGPATRPGVGPAGGAAPGAAQGAGRRGGAPGGGMGSAFAKIFIEDLVPNIDSTYRTLADRDHRAIAGLSMGGMQTLGIGLNNLDMFAYIGGFSSAGGQFPNTRTGPLSDADTFNKKVKVFWLSLGSEETAGYNGNQGFHQTLEKAGIKHVYYESPGTAHEWQTWRRSLHGFAPLLFRD